MEKISVPGQFNRGEKCGAQQMEGCPKSAGNVTGSGLNQQTLSYF